jgi:hypothetical protein
MVNNRRNLGGNKRGRKKTKYGKNVTLFLSNEAIGKLVKLSEGKQSQYVEEIIMKEWKKSAHHKETEEEVLLNSLLLQ